MLLEELVRVFFFVCLKLIGHRAEDLSAKLMQRLRKYLFDLGNGIIAFCRFFLATQKNRICHSSGDGIVQYVNFFEFFLLVSNLFLCNRQVGFSLLCLYLPPYGKANKKMLQYRSMQARGCLDYSRCRLSNSPKEVPARKAEAP